MQSLVVLIFAGVLASKGKQKFYVVRAVRIPFVRDDPFFAIKELINGDGFTHGGSIAEQELVKIADALSSGKLM